MNDNFHAKYRAHQQHQAAVPLAIGKVQAHLIDFDGQPIADEASPIDGLHCGELRTLLNEVERLQAREIAAEARWQERNERDGDPYGTY